MRSIKSLCVHVGLAICLLGSSVTAVQAANGFVIKNIQVEGLEGLSTETVLSYMPVQAGQRFNPADSSKIIRTLYGTGFFDNVSLSSAGNTLIVKVIERPVITTISYSGNKALQKDRLDEVLKNVGLVQGSTFDQSSLELLKKSLETEYDNIGKYSAQVTTTVTPQSRHRVAVKIDISEGRTAQVRQITIIGNQVFSTHKLIGAMTLSTPHFWSFFTRADQYSQEKLDKSLEDLRSYYMDRGYLKFHIDSTQATVTPNHNYIYLTIHVTEGPIYTLKGYQVEGSTIISQATLNRIIKLKPGAVFSRKEVREGASAITHVLGNMGFAFATVDSAPDIDEKNKQVFVTYYLQPGNRVYVHRVNIIGNAKTQDVVLRRVMPQMEGGLVSTDSIKESERQLNLLGYLDNVNTQTTMVSGSSDQVDLNYNIKESPSAQVVFSVGYGTDGAIFGIGLTQNNFLGTGNSLGINAQKDVYNRVYSINYTNPYYTPDGVSRSISAYSQHTTPGNLNLSSYTSNTYGANVNYGIPISAKGDVFSLGYGYQVTNLSLGSDTSTQLVNFTNKYGTNFKQLLLSSGWSRDGLDRAFFPTKGTNQRVDLQVSLPSGGKPLNYYKTDYNLNFYHPITSNYIFYARSFLGYGKAFGPTEYFPFFANYYAGGPEGYDGQVRGYETNTLGPRDSTGQPMGGNMVASATAAIIFPNPISPDKLRTSVFVDAGNSYTSLPATYGGNSAGPLRYSTGISADWRVPVLNVMLNVSLAKAIRPQPHDHLEVFQFNIGTNF